MTLFDLSLDELWRHRPRVTPPADLDGFWAETLAEARAAAAPAVAARVRTPLTQVTTYDVSFTGYAGQQIKAWLNLPAGAVGPLPVVVEFIGYGGGRGRPHEWLLWAAAGYAHLVMDTRGQGASWRGGDTPDPGPDGTGPSVPGYLTRGVLDPRGYYYRRLVTDAVRAVEIAGELPGVDADRLAVVGCSQGGGLALAAASLASVPIRAVVSQVPFLCHIRRAVTITDADPYAELVRFCRIHPDRAAAALTTTDYVDMVHLTPRATAPALFSAALMDEICPPSTVFAAYHAYGGPKEMEVYEWDGHEGGRAHFAHRSLEFVAALVH
ncbi:cephalosporin-C deacetylase [Micromonospora pattaloongensis]|uniref:Cephalosporin-C deacetylase n=1 Tax=Micromonospora pattaloongensis TaxID=405436 RepID=A0A1H3G1Z4_9ACTN|nr:alpha/beta fold hydrolase [Micromonospora pattaloongensis]SDX97323.1 cephalosporin-C deacetylase [Micromonospora pattaloongensis]